MGRLVDADLLKEKAVRFSFSTNKWVSDVDIDLMPTVDAVPVVRCNDCKHSFILKDSSLYALPPYCFYHGNCRMCGCENLIGDETITVQDDFYCGYGERKE